MNAIIQGQTIEGYKVGAGPITAGLVIFCMVACISFNTYHMSNYIIVKMSINGVFATGFFYLLGAAIASLEVPLAKSVVANYRLSRCIDATVGALLIFSVAVASLAGFAGWNSQLADADIKQTQIAAHWTKGASYTNLKTAAEGTYRAAKLKAGLIKDKSSREIALAEAWADYQVELANLTIDKSAHELKKPVQMFEADSLSSKISMLLFTFVCSIGAFFCSGFLVVYVNPLVAFAQWKSSEDRFQPVTHLLSPLSKRIKVISNAKINTPSSEAEKNRPGPLDTSAGAVLNTEKTASERPLKQGGKEGATVEFSGRHYRAVKEAIIKEKIKPTQKPVKKMLVDLRVKFVDDPARQEKAVFILDQLFSEGVLIENPEYKKTKKIVSQYLLNPDYRGGAADVGPVDWAEIIARLDRGGYVDPEEVGDSGDGTGRKPQGWIDYERKQLEEALNGKSESKVEGGVISYAGGVYSFTPDGFGRGAFDFATVCTGCSVNYTDVLKIEKRKGTVKCSKCGRCHVAATKQYDKKQNYDEMLREAKKQGG